jgi:hypothetical protein
VAKQDAASTKVEKALKQGGFQVQKGIVVGSSSPDYYVVSPSGTSAVIEVKTWQANPSNVKFASDLAASYRDQSGADRAFVVIPGLYRSHPSTGVVSPDALRDVLPSLSEPPSRRKTRRRPRLRSRPKKFLFAAMPFTEGFELLFDTVLEPAALDAGVRLRRIDRQPFTGDIVTQIKRLIRSSAGMVADLSGVNPNVIYELGIAHGCGRRVIQVSSTSLKDLPFNLRNNKTIPYSPTRPKALRKQLTREIRALIKNR